MVTVFTREPPKQASLAADAKGIAVVCTKCSNHFQISPEAYQAALKARPASEPEARAGVGRRSDKSVGLEFPCPTCNESTGRLAAHCSKHDTYFVKYTETGGNAVCPECR